MSAPLMSIVEGWTGALPFTLNADGEPFDLTGLTVEIILKSADGTYVQQDATGVSVTASTAGEVQYEPTSTGTFLAAQTPYRVRFRVTDALSKVAYFPNDEEELIEVNPI